MIDPTQLVRHWSMGLTADAIRRPLAGQSLDLESIGGTIGGGAMGAQR
jgi:hypothetical protein